jgi:hypothetical protein
METETSSREYIEEDRMGVGNSFELGRRGLERVAGSILKKMGRESIGIQQTGTSRTSLA